MGLSILSPFLGIIAIKIDDPGPVFFVRKGRGKMEVMLPFCVASRLADGLL